MRKTQPKKPSRPVEIELTKVGGRVVGGYCEQMELKYENYVTG
jgi:hypothetical protein